MAMVRARLRGCAGSKSGPPLPDRTALSQRTEGMMAAQLVAAHNIDVLSMIDEQNPEARRENLAQAGKLSRTVATLLEALNRHRGKGQQKMTVEHVHVHSCGGGRRGASVRRGSREIGGSIPCQANCPCTSVRDAVRG
jgi:hypothetical protein